MNPQPSDHESGTVATTELYVSMLTRSVVQIASWPPVLSFLLFRLHRYRAETVDFEDGQSRLDAGASERRLPHKSWTGNQPCQSLLARESVTRRDVGEKLVQSCEKRSRGPKTGLVKIN